MVDQLHVKNHFVPQFYLKRWENTSRKIQVYKTLVSNSRAPIWKPYSVSAIAYHKHLYTQVLNGAESDEVENWFCEEFESPANDVIDKAINDRRLSKEDWNILIRFLAAQDVRTPSRMLDHMRWASASMKDNLDKVLQGVKDQLEKRSLNALELTDSSIKNAELFPLKVITEVDKLNDTMTFKLETYVGRSSWIYSIKHVLEDTAKILHKHQWTIVKPAKGYYWITSDNPVINLNYVDQNNYDLKGGWGKTNGNIIFPIGPEHAMFVQIGDKPIKKGSRLTINQTISLRKLIVENSHRMIFSSFEDDDVIKLKKRIVNPDLIRREKEEMQSWHSKNSELELEYLGINRPT